MAQADDEFDFDHDDEDSEDSESSEQKIAEFVELIDETFEPHTTSDQWHRDHVEGYNTVDEDGMPRANPRHNDGESIYQAFNLEPLPSFLARAARMRHPVAQHPKALAHFLSHLKEWEKWELGDYDPWDPHEPDFDGAPAKRKQLFEWYLGIDKRGTDSLTAPAPDEDIAEQEKAMNDRLKRLRPGGTGVIMHGEQGTTKTTGMHWLVTNLMEVNPSENTFWLSTLDDTEWQVFAPWATLLLPSGVDVEVTVNPHAREYRDVGEFEIDPEHIARAVIRYDDPADLMNILADRTPGQIYVVYPDPQFRQAGRLTGYTYETIWDVDTVEDATPLGHYWFALTEAFRQTNVYNDWTTFVADEAHKWLRHGKGNDEHDWWNKIEDWATYWGDARKKRMSVILAVHKWKEISSMVRDKVRWGVTMNGEQFPSDAPLDGQNKYDQDLGDFCIWNNLEWNHTGYPDLKRKFSVPADISVSYPTYEAERDAKS